MAGGKLNRIQHRTLPQAKVALMLVGYDQGVQEAIEYVFGSTLVCESLEVERVLMVGGDVFELSGIVEGGVLEASGKELGAMRGGAAKSALELALHKLEVLEKVGDELKHLLEEAYDEKLRRV